MQLENIPHVNPLEKVLAHPSRMIMCTSLKIILPAPKNNTYYVIFNRKTLLQRNTEQAVDLDFGKMVFLAACGVFASTVFRLFKLCPLAGLAVGVALGDWRLDLR